MEKNRSLKIREKLQGIISSRYFQFCFIVTGFIALVILRQLVKSFGVSLGYLYIILISLAGFWFGFKGAILSAILSSIIFIFEVMSYADWPARDLVITGIPFRFIVYFSSGLIIGYFCELQKKLSHKIEYLAYHDGLTGCINYTWIIDFLEKEIARSRRFIKEFTIILIDIDHFKKINDKYGHLVGNDALVTFANVIKNNVRSMDIVGRYGGEEFLIIFPELGFDGALEVLKRIKKKLSEIEITSPHLKEKIDIPLQFSAGVASFPYNANTTKDLIQVADDVLYQAKQKGRDRIVTDRRRCVRLKPLKGLRIEMANLSDRKRLKIKDIDNISERGMLLLFPHDIQEQELLCRISLPDQDFPPEFICKVIHKKKVENEVYRVGVYFLNIPAYTRGRLLHFTHQSRS